jgi:hypothetical protein
MPPLHHLSVVRACRICHLDSVLRLQPDPEPGVLGMLVDRRDELGRARTQTVNRLHRLLTELFPGGAKKFLSATQARALVSTFKPRDIVGKTRRPTGGRVDHRARDYRQEDQDR